ncbi:hypothetical protein Pcinc_016812 [Petrolisthes cinctipes]|uniref:Uncharacterized protein n=1 Tax=Petrolisthes cinctipes TaxID=88211 RepID=A0AAE1FSS9_PETCI|nr:hypothetical protein Pcinc_016812 [Petrolisthes cinctipes]
MDVLEPHIDGSSVQASSSLTFLFHGYHSLVLPHPFLVYLIIDPSALSSVTQFYPFPSLYLAPSPPGRRGDIAS